MLIFVIDIDITNTNEIETENIEERNIPVAIESTMKQMIQQMDVLTSTVRLRY